MPIKEKILGYFKRRFNIVKSRETTPIKITEITKLGSDLDDYVNKILNILPKIEQARTGVLSEFGARLEGIDESLKEMVEELDKMKNYPQISKDEFNTWLSEFENKIKARLDELEKKALQVQPSELEKFERVDTSLNEIADELEKMKSLHQISEDELKLIEDIKKAKEELQGLDRNSLEKYTLSLEAAALFSDVDELPIESDEEIREHDKEIQKAVAQIAPAIIKTRIDKFENEINERMNELQKKALQAPSSKIFDESRISHFIGVLDYKKGLYQKALKNFEDIVKMNPTNEGWLNKGAALGMLGEFEEESACYEEALKDPEYQDAWINKGLAFLDKDDKKAEACFTKACEIILTKQEKD